MYINIQKKLILNRPHLTGEHDVVSFAELPAEQLSKLKDLHADELVDALFQILKQIAVAEYVTRIEYSLSEREKEGLYYYGRPMQNEFDFMDNAIHDALGSSNEKRKIRFEVWFRNYFIPSIGNILPLEPDKAFEKEFEKKLNRVVCLRARKQKLMKIKKKCFFKKRARAEKLIGQIHDYLCDTSVGLYGVLLYAFTLYSRKSKNYLMFDMHIKQAQFSH